MERLLSVRVPRRLRCGLCAAVLAGCGPAGGDAPIEYRPPVSVERLATATFDLPGAAQVHDFDAAGDRLYLLERWGRVLVAGRGSGGWALEHAFGRRGSGPGEFENPTGIAATPTGVVVAEAHRLQFFDATGHSSSARPLILPCPVARPGIAAGSGGLFVHGNCVRPGFVTDTMKAVLAWAADGEEFVTLSEEIRFTRDGGIGSIFGATRAFTPGADGWHLFGPGTLNCISRVEEGPDEPAVLRQCPAAGHAYRADPPPDVERRLRAGVPGLRVTWPAALPAYVERVAVGDTIILLRPFTADSVVLQTAAPESRDLAVVPLDGLVGCRADGCLWVFEEPAGAVAWFLETTRIRGLLRRRGGR